MNLLAQVGLKSCWEFEDVAFLLSQPNTNCSVTKKTALKRTLVSAGACRDSGQPQVIDLLREWCVAIAGCPRVVFAVDLVWATRTFLTRCHCAQRCDTTSRRNRMGVTLLYLHKLPAVICTSMVVSQLQTLNRAPQECVVAARPQPTKHRGFETQLHVQPLLH